jgi:predicted branched-subunit amino acid permease
LSKSIYEGTDVIFTSFFPSMFMTLRKTERRRQVHLVSYALMISYYRRKPAAVLLRCGWLSGLVAAVTQTQETERLKRESSPLPLLDKR